MGLLELFEFNRQMDESIMDLFDNILKENLKNPSQAAFVLKTIRSQQKAAKRREKNERQGLHVPPFMIASITERCNLKCAGCYAHARHPQSSAETDFTRLQSMVGEARELGISIILLAGGEPLVRKQEILSIARAHRDVIFPVFTNGLLMDRQLIQCLKSTKNAVPIISIEGPEADTDRRRGKGIYAKLKKLFADLHESNVFYGCSITVTSENADTVTAPGFARELVDSGCKLFFFVEYVPVEHGTEHLVLDESRRQLLIERIDSLRANLPASFIAFPGDEKHFGGCLASGRGFIHVNPAGGVEPCPFAPFSDSSIKDRSLRECLESGFLKKIRENHSLLNENQGGCALWENRELVESYLAKQQTKLP